jgi:ribosomal protein S27AE
MPSHSSSTTQERTAKQCQHLLPLLRFPAATIHQVGPVGHRWLFRSVKVCFVFLSFFFCFSNRSDKSMSLAYFSRDASEDDLRLWLPQPEKSVQELDVDMSLFLLTHVGDQFCWMVQTEKEAKAEALAAEAEDGDTVQQQIAWKRVVQGVREMCDVCETTLFNFHWACGKCGYVVCIDCYKTRKAAKSPSNGSGSGNKDDEKEVGRGYFYFFLSLSLSPSLSLYQ